MIRRYLADLGAALIGWGFLLLLQALLLYVAYLCGVGQGRRWQARWHVGQAIEDAVAETVVIPAQRGGEL